MNNIELVEVDHASAVFAGEQNIGKAVVPEDIFGGECVPCVDGFGEGFIESGERDDDISAIAPLGINGIAI